MEVTLVKRVIAARHIKSCHIFFFSISVQIVVAQHMIFFSLEFVPHFPVWNVGAVQPDEVAQLYQEIHVLAIGRLYYRLHAFQAVRDVRCVQVGNNGKAYGLHFFLRAGKQAQCCE